MLIFHKFDIDMNQVTLNDTVIPRPAHVSVTEWMAFWERAFEASERVAGRTHLSYSYKGRT